MDWDLIFQDAASRLDTALRRFFAHTGESDLGQVNEANVSVQIAAAIGANCPAVSVVFEPPIGNRERADILGVDDHRKIRFVIESKKDIRDIGLGFRSSLADAVRMKRSEKFAGAERVLAILVSDDMIDRTIGSTQARRWQPLRDLLVNIYRGEQETWGTDQISETIAPCLVRQGRVPRMVAEWGGVIRDVATNRISLQIKSRASLEHSRARLVAALIS